MSGDHGAGHDGGLFELSTTSATSEATPTGAREPEQPPSRRGAAPAVNDMDLIEAVLSRATEPGYVLVHAGGTGEWVWRRRVRRGPDVEPVTGEEANAVLQLLDQRFLTRGGTHDVRRGGRIGPATSVLLTDAARTRLRRWRAYTRPTSWGPPSTVA
jgi:hypothetical protein